MCTGYIPWLGNFPQPICRFSLAKIFHIADIWIYLRKPARRCCWKASFNCFQWRSVFMVLHKLTIVSGRCRWKIVIQTHNRTGKILLKILIDSLAPANAFTFQYFTHMHTYDRVAALLLKIIMFKYGTRTGERSRLYRAMFLNIVISNQENALCVEKCGLFVHALKSNYQ